MARRANGAKDTDGEESHAEVGREGREGTRTNEAVLVTAGRTLNSSMGTKPGGVGVVSGHVGGPGGVKRLHLNAGVDVWGLKAQDHNVRSVGESGSHRAPRA